MTFLIDTQAEVSILKIGSTLPKTLIDTSDVCNLTGITDGRVTSFGSSIINIFLDKDNSLKQRFQIVKNSFPIPTDGILGKDFIWKNQCTICTYDHALYIRLRNLKFSVKLSHDFDDEIWIPPRSEVVRKLTVQTENDVVIENGMIDSDVFVAGSISSGKNCFVRIMNTSTYMKRVKQTDIKYKLLDDYDVYYTKSTQRAQNLMQSINSENVPPNFMQLFSKLCENYSDIFYLSGDYLTVNNFYTQEIHPLDRTPIYRKNYRIPEAQKKEVDRQIAEMLKENIIEPSNSPYNNPIFLVPKKSNDSTPKWRLVVDFRALNEKILPDRFPLPRMEEILDSLGRAKYFSTLDLQSGFHQVPLTHESRKFTAFSTTSGHFQYTRLPFGLNISPNSFQRMMGIALSGLPPDVAFLYIDDIIVVGGSEKHHLTNLEKVFKCLRARNLRLNPGKCSFFCRETTFLGHKVTSEGILPYNSKLDALRDYPTPVNAAEVKRFVAFANYYRRFIPNFSVIADPLHRLSVKGVAFEWSRECDEAFNKLRRALMSPPVLVYPDFNKEFVLITDASDKGCGAKLAQMHNGVEKPVAFASTAFKKGDLNRPPIEKEMMAIYFAILHFRPYLFGRKFTVKTDHKPLIHMYSMKDPTSKVVRMRLELNEYDFQIVYLPGHENVEADALSRIDFSSIKNHEILAITRSMTRKNNYSQPEQREVEREGLICENPGIYEVINPNEVKGLPLLKFSLSDIAIVYEVRLGRSLLFNGDVFTDVSSIEDDPDRLRNLIEEIQGKALKHGIKRMALQLRNDIFRYISPVLFKTEASKHLNKLEIVLFEARQRIKDPNEIQGILVEFHNDPIGGHSGQQRMLERLRRKFVWKNMRGDVKRFVNSCHECKMNKHAPGTKEKFVETTTPANTFDIVSIDTVGPLPLSAKGNRYILTLQCDLSKFVVCAPMPNKEANCVAKTFVEYFVLLYGIPKTIKSDLGTEFVNEVMKQICEVLRIKHIKSTSYHHETLGGVERMHRVLNEYLRSSIDQNSLNWD